MQQIQLCSNAFSKRLSRLHIMPLSMCTLCIRRCIWIVSVDRHPHFFLRLTGDEADAFPLNIAVALPLVPHGSGTEWVMKCTQWLNANVSEFAVCHVFMTFLSAPFSCAPIPRARASAMIVARGTGIQQYGNPPPPITHTCISARAHTPVKASCRGCCPSLFSAEMSPTSYLRRFQAPYSHERNVFEMVRGIFPRTL